jgi:anti-sigma B factor antagonist
MSAFRIEARLNASVWTLRLYGEADLAVAEQILEVGAALVSEPNTTAVIVDMADLTFIDSTGLGALVRLRNLAMASNKTVHLAQPSERVKRVLDISGLATVFDTPLDAS